MTKQRVQPKTYNCLLSMNRPIYFGGVSSVQGFGVLVFIMIITGAFGIIAGALAVILTVYILTKIGSENKKGNPDYLDSLFKFQATKRNFTDKSNLLGYLSKGGN